MKCVGGCEASDMHTSKYGWKTAYQTSQREAMTAVELTIVYLDKQKSSFA